MTARLLLIAAALLVAAPAYAGDYTSTPPWLRGDIHAGYQGSVGVLELQDREVIAGPLSEVGRAVEHAHAIHIGGIFSAYHGIAVRLDIPIIAHDQRVWLTANSLRYDPDYGRPTAVGSPALGGDVLEDSTSSRIHNGFGDITLGFRAVPFAESGVPGRTAPVSLAVDLDLTFPSGASHDKLRDNGTGGPGVGGMQLGLGLAISRRLAGSEPYLRVAYTHRAPYKVDLASAQVQLSTVEVDDEGRTTLNPADQLTLGFGAEIIAQENLAADTSIRLDVGVAFTYVSDHQVSSGTYLPAPLEPTVGHRAAAGEHVVIEAGLGVRVRPKPQVELVIDLDGGWVSPHVLEQVDSKSYSMRSGPASFLMRFGMGAIVRLR